MRRLLAILALLAAPGALAQPDADPDAGEAPEANQGRAEWVYGALVVGATLLVGGVLAWLSHRQARLRRGGPGGGWRRAP